MLLLLMMNIIAVDTTVSWRFFLSTTFCTCRSDLLFTDITLSFLLAMILSLVGKILLTLRFCTTTIITTVPFLCFELLSSILVSCRPTITSTADYTKGLLALGSFTTDLVCSFRAFSRTNLERRQRWTEKVNVNGKSVKNNSNSRDRTMKLLLKNFHDFLTNFSNTRSQKNEYTKCWFNFWSKWMQYNI